MNDQRDRVEPVEQPLTMTYRQMLEKVRHEGAYPSVERAEDAARSVLAGLGRQLTGEERVALAARLPRQAARIFAAQVPAVHPFSGQDFVEDLAVRSDLDPALARWDAGSVLPVVAAAAGPSLITRILQQLPAGYGLLFGRAELVPVA